MGKPRDSNAKALAGAALLALLAGCFNSRVPVGAQLTCSTDQDCPPGLVCRKVAHRCLDPLSLDTTPPALEGPVDVSPAVARAGLPVAIAFRTTEPLLVDPTVLVGERPAIVDEEGTARSERRYRFALVPDGTEPQDPPASVRITLVDQTGNEAAGLLAGTVRFDFAAPAIAGEVEVQLEAPPRSLVDPVAKAGVGSRVSVALGFDEAAGAEPVVEALWAQADPGAPKKEEVLSFVRRSGGPTSYVFEHVLVASAVPQGPYVLRVAVKDAAGNEASHTLAVGFEVDTLAPEAPDVATEGRVVFRREPWGTEAGAGVPRMSVQALPGGVGAGDALYVFSHDLHGELGHAAADDRGAVVVDLFYADLSRVYVRAVDGAGNASPEVQVRDLEWVATLGGKVAGSTRENPHQFVSRSRMGRHLTGQVGPLYGARPQGGEALAAVDASAAGGVVRQTGEPTWSLRDPRARPIFGCKLGSYALGGALMVRDAARDQVVSLSGDGLTWIWSGEDWRPVTTVDPEGDGDPPPRCGGSLVYDERRGEVVLVGGMGATGETWVWNGSSWRLASIGEGPTARTHAAVAYDKVREEVLFFGGSPALTGTRQDTWTWDGERWHELAPAHVPPRRYGAGIAWDPSSQALVMFGGHSTTNGVDSFRVNDFWRWDGTDWTQIPPGSPADPWPSARSMATMLLDPARGHVVLFGGGADKSLEADLKVWDWDGASWSSRTATPTPLDLRGVPEYAAFNLYPGRGASAVYYDVARDRVVLFGGVLEYPWPGAGRGYLAVDDLWEWDPAAGAWTDRTPPDDAATGKPPAPAPGFAAAMAYDEQRRRAVLFGGSREVDQNTIYGPTSDELWTWDGRAWTQVPGGTPPWPESRASHAMAYDASRGATVMFGGWDSDGDTWERTDAWRLGVAGSTLSGKPWLGAAMSALDVQGAVQVVRFGGLGTILSPALDVLVVRSADTATWSGSSWVLASPATRPVPRHMAALGPDGRGGLILFGGETSATNPEELPFKGQRRNDTWRWDGAAWTQLQGNDPSLAPSVRPEARMGHTMVYDSDRGRLVLADGYGTGPISDLWEWDPARQDWLRRVPSNPDSGKVPLPAMARAAAYDSGRKRMLFFGGQTSTKTIDEFWELDAGTGERPGHVFSVALGESGFPAEAALTRVQARVVAGARAPGKDGVEVWGWLPDGWQVLASDGTATPEALASVSGLVDDPPRLARIAFQDGLHFAVVPRGTNAATPAEVVTDYVEAVVRSRLPP
ncbi:MAG TPA: kelch repeat-containing protein [Myxococcales bacterium]|jgi:hypothetical protein